MDNAFRAKLKAFAEKLPEMVARKTATLGAELLTRVKDKTPVDTGAAREAWRLTIEGSGFEARAVVSNPLPYVAALENGSSAQAPLGMVALSIEEMKKR
jgi:hypothetical protein